MLWGSIVDFCCCLVTKSHLTLCDHTDCSLPDSSVHEISQARILEWVALSFSRGSSQPRDRTRISWLAGRFFTTEPSGKPTVDLECVSLRCAALFQSCIHLYLFFQSFLLSLHFSLVTQSCPTPCDPMDCSMPGLTVHYQLPELAQTHVHRVGEAILSLIDYYKRLSRVPWAVQ